MNSTPRDEYARWAWCHHLAKEVRQAIENEPDDGTNRREVVVRLLNANMDNLDQVMVMPHVYNEEDAWYSCSQAIDPYSADKAPGSGCGNDERRGGICDCGVASIQHRTLVVTETALTQIMNVIDSQEQANA